MNKPNIRIISNSVNEDDILSTWQVDPNPAGADVYDMEDYFLYASLTALVKNRSLILEDGDTIELNNQLGDEVSFITTTEQNGDKYVTTNYLDIGEGEYSVEGFGIEEILIDIQTNFVPKVTITFYDVRGGSFAFYENLSDSQKNENPLSVFFKLPYPIFNLTLKGYYGKAVSYCLHLLNFNATFDPQTGGFRITTEFIGYTYAFLADLPLNLIVANSNTEQGKKRLEKLGIDSLSTFFNKLASITNLTQNFKNNDARFLQLKVVNTALSSIDSLERKIGPKKSELDESLTSNNISSNIPNSEYIVIRDVGIFNSEYVNQFDIFLNEVKQILEQYQTFILENSVNQYKINESLFKDNLVYNITQSVNEINSLVSQNEDEYFYTVVESDLENGLNLQTVTPPYNPLFFIVNFFPLREEIARLKKTLIEEKTKYENLILEAINEKITDSIGYDLTVENVFKIITSNIDVFLDTLNSVSIKASDEAIRNLRSSLINTNDAIFPFPDYIEQNEKKWLGDKINNQSDGFPEVSYVNDILNATFKINSENKTSELKNAAFNRLESNRDNWFSLYALDIISNEYASLRNRLFDADGLPSIDFYRSFANQMFSPIVNSNLFSPNNADMLKKYALLDSIYFYSAYKETNIIKGINNINQADFISNLLNAIDDSITTTDGNIYDVKLMIDQDAIIGVNQSLKRQYSDKRNKQFNNRQSDFLNENFEDISKYYSRLNFIIQNDGVLFKNLLKESWSNKIIKNLNEISPLEITDLKIAPDLRFIVENNDFFYINPNAGVYTISGNKRISIIYDYLLNDDNNDHVNKLSFFNSIFYSNIFKDIADNEDFFVKKSCIANYPYSYVLYLGSLFYFIKNEKELFSLNYKKNFFTLDVIVKVERISESFREKVITVFEDWYDDNYDDFFYDVEVFAEVNQRNAIIQEDDSYYNLYVQSYNNLYTFFTADIDIILNDIQQIYPFNSYNDVPINYIENYIAIWKQNLIRLKNEDETITEDNQPDLDNIVIDSDIKLALYDDLQTIYNKWLGYGHEKGQIYNSCLNIGEGGLLSHFHFIDRAWNDIGSKAVINPLDILSLTRNPKISIWAFITKILNDAKFIVLATPSQISLRNEQDVFEMFTPQTTLDNIVSSPSIVAMYIGGNSKTLDITGDFLNDGFDISDNKKIPDDFKEHRLPSRFNENAIQKSKYNLTIFDVNFGQINQSHFKDVTVGMNEHRNSAEYFKTISDFFDREGGNTKRYYKGLNLYDLYLLRSYTSEVTSLGNLLYQPMMYYQLNVPFFNGVYVIIEVNHSISNGQHETKFKGYRLPRFVYPIIENVTSYIKIDLSDAFNVKNVSLIEPVNVNLTEDSIGADGGEQAIDPALLSDNILFSVLNENNVQINYLLENGLTVTEFNNRLKSTFLNNPISMSTYGLGSGLCMAWVKNVLRNVGIISTPFGGLDAWDLYAGLYEGKMKYFSDLFRVGSSVQRDYDSVIEDKLALIFGYFKTSKYKETSISAIKAKNNSLKLINLANNNNSSFDISPITHIGIYYNGIFYDFTNRTVRANPVTSFVPVAYYELYNDAILKINSSNA